MKLSDKISAWLKDKGSEAEARGCILGLSGGVDSAVVGALCKKAFPDNTLALIMPCHSHAEDLEHAKLVAGKFSIENKTIDLSSDFDLLYKSYEGKDFIAGKRELSVANLKPRLRMLSLYYFANKLNYLVVGTGNKSELAMGYFTKYGDGGVDLLPLGGLLKFQVRELAKELGIPSEIIDKAPSAGLWEGQTDEGEMEMTYAELDKTIEAMEAGNESLCDAKVLAKIKNQQSKIKHKCDLPPVFKN